MLPDIYRETLARYWGFTSFRPMQEEIIESVVSGKDVVGLLPTGGGKSVTYQVPPVASEGLCLVITPLIALMKDQVARLKTMNIKAMAIHSGMSREEVEISLDNCLYGDYRLLYVSPERLQTPLFRARNKGSDE
jgi:ATP-dependent DNA helicase RecQ